MTTIAEFRAAFRLDELTIARTEHWTWSVRPIQTTLGAGVLSLNELCPTFGGMTAEQGAGLATASALVESRLRSAFGAERFNYLVFMMNDHHVHAHVIPRYSSSRDFAGITWVDERWPLPAKIPGTARTADISVLAAVRDRLATS